MYYYITPSRGHCIPSGGTVYCEPNGRTVMLNISATKYSCGLIRDNRMHSKKNLNSHLKKDT